MSTATCILCVKVMSALSSAQCKSHLRRREISRTAGLPPAYL